MEDTKQRGEKEERREDKRKKWENSYARSTHNFFSEMILHAPDSNFVTSLNKDQTIFTLHMHDIAQLHVCTIQTVVHAN